MGTDQVIAFRLLGSIEAVRNGRPLALGGPRQRALLALLLLTPGRSVAVDRLMEELWAGEPPEGAEATLRSYVSRLRLVLGAEPAISRTPSGYVIHVDAERLDVRQFENLVGEGEEAIARRQARRAKQRLDAALERWLGRPFGDLADDGALGAEARRLEGLRLRAIELRLDAELALGGAGELVDGLEALVREHPYHEVFWRQLMLALYRSDRQADALEAYQRARAALDEQLGLEPGPRLQALQTAILRHEVPAPQPLQQRHNLPAPLTSFVGREAELATITQLLDGARLVTLTGVGGVGKTRLAIEAARPAVEHQPDGVLMIDLSTTSDPAAVAGRLGAALDVPLDARRAPIERLVAALRTKEMLLVLDNCEHVREASADVVRRLLETCPDLRVLATSREVLGVPGEVAFTVPPLSVPDAGADAQTSRGSEAVRLFLARAREARPDLTEDDALVELARAICADLDGLPLAIELAAARVRALSPSDIAERLRDRFRFLVSWRRIAPARHRTLREAMDWSYGLLGPEEQLLLGRLSVFAGGFSLEAAAVVCVDANSDRALALLERLTEASLVLIEPAVDVTRYRMLETVRQYAAEGFRASPESDDPRERHAAHFLALAESANLTAEAEGPQRHDIVAREETNVRAALTWATEEGRIDLALLIAVALENFWATRDPREGLRILEGLLERDGAVSLELRARALRALGGCAHMVGDRHRARKLFEDSLAAYRQLGDDRGVAILTFRRGLVELELGEVDAAREDVEASLLAFRRLESRRGETQALGALGSIDAAEGRTDRAIERWERSAAMAADIGRPWWQTEMLDRLTRIALETERIGIARARARELLEVASRIGSRKALVHGLAYLACTAVAQGDASEGAVLWGTAEAEDRRRPVGDWEQDREWFAARLPGLEPAKDQLMLEEAVARALG